MRSESAGGDPYLLVFHKGYAPKERSGMMPHESSTIRKEPMKTAVCRALNRDGSECRRKIAPGAKRCWQHARGLRTRLRAVPRSAALLFALAFLSVAVGIVALLGPCLLRLLPGPKVDVVITGLRVKAGNASGCVVYMVSLFSPDEPLEGIYFTIQFPGNIAGYRFGAGSAAELETTGRTGIAAFEVGKDSSGECEVIQAAVAPSPDFTATIAGPGMVQVRGARILPQTMATGIFALSVKKPSFQPASMFKEGFYEYKRLVFTISKPLEFVDNGVQDAK